MNSLLLLLETDHQVHIDWNVLIVEFTRNKAVLANCRHHALIDCLADRLDQMNILRRAALIYSKTDNHMLRSQIAGWEISR